MANPMTDPVLITAGDRPTPSQDSLPALVDPANDHQNDAVAARRKDVEEKHQRVIRFLEESGYEGVLLTRSDSLAWMTAGADLGQSMCSELGAVQLFVNPRCRAVVCDNVQTARVFEEELAGLGFQLKEWPWQSDPRSLVSDLTRGKKVATDGVPLGSTMVQEREKLHALRYPFTPLERQRLRELGRTLTLMLEATCRNFEPGESEADLAGHLAHRLMREGVVPLDLRVAADDRLTRYRQPLFKSVAIQKRATVMAVVKRHGLVAAATRGVSFGPLDSNFQMAHALAAMVDATCIYFSRSDEKVSEVFRRARRIFEKYRRPDEWMLDYQGFLSGYFNREEPLYPSGDAVLRHGTPVTWCPTVDDARSQDTMVVDERGFEIVTAAQNWPKLEVEVKGYAVTRPGILIR